MGIIVGGLFSWSFFSLEKSWYKIIGGAVFTGGVIPGGGFILNMFALEQNVKIYCLAFYLAFLILFFIIFLRYMFKKLERQHAEFSYISVFDILFGHTSFKEMYYEQKNKEFNARLDVVNQKIASLDFEKKVYQDAANNLELEKKTIQKIKKQLKEQSEKSVHITLPVNHPIPINQSFMSDFPLLLDKVTAFTKEINFFTKSLVDDLRANMQTNSNEKVLGFFQAVCNKISQIIFADADVRVHFRYLNNNQYVKLVTSYDKDAVTYILTPIENDRPNLIVAAGKASRSLIKSLNIENHQPTKRESKWTDYLTIIFDEFTDEKSGNPLISMGISIREGEYRERTLIYLNYIEIEKIIQDNIKEINNIVNIAQFLKSMSNGSSNQQS